MRFAAVVLVFLASVMPGTAFAAEWVQVAIKGVSNDVIYSESVNNAQSAQYPITRSFSGHDLKITRTVANQDTTYCFEFRPNAGSWEELCFVMSTEVRGARVLEDYVIAVAGSDDSGSAPDISVGALGTGTPGETSSAADDEATTGECCCDYNGTEKCSGKKTCTNGHICDCANCEPPCIDCK